MLKLKVRSPISKQRRTLLTMASFLLPVLIWAMVSYVPGIWQPLVLVDNAGDESIEGDYDYLSAGQRVEKEVFEKRNETLAKAGAPLATGQPVNPIYLPAPHEVAMALYTAFLTEPKRRGEKR